MHSVCKAQYRADSSDTPKMWVRGGACPRGLAQNHDKNLPPKQNPGLVEGAQLAFKADFCLVFGGDA